MKQVFNALSGTELKKAILAELEREMDLSGEFRGHVTYPWVRFEASIKILSYPKQDMNADPVEVAKVEGELVGDGVENIPSGPPEVVVELGKKQVIDTPDQVRVETNQPVPTQASAAGVQVDKPILRPAPTAPAKPVQVKPVSATAPATPKVTNTNKPADGSPVGIPGIDGSL